MEKGCERSKLVEALLATPGVRQVSAFNEQATTADWLITPPTTRASVQVLPDPKNRSVRIMLANGLISRTFLVAAGNLGCISLRQSPEDIEFVRAIKPEVRVRLDGGDWTDIRVKQVEKTIHTLKEFFQLSAVASDKIVPGD